MLNMGRADRLYGGVPIPYPFLGHSGWTRHQPPLWQGQHQPAKVCPGPPAPGTQGAPLPLREHWGVPDWARVPARDPSSFSPLALADPSPVGPSEWWGRCVNKPVSGVCTWRPEEGGTHCDILGSRA